MLQELRDQMQGPLKVSSGRRCDHHNGPVSTMKNKKNGVYILGQASDILISGEWTMLLFEKARQLGFSGIGISLRGHHRDRFVHLTRNLLKPSSPSELLTGPMTIMQRAYFQLKTFQMDLQSIRKKAKCFFIQLAPS